MGGNRRLGLYETFVPGTQRSYIALEEGVPEQEHSFIAPTRNPSLLSPGGTFLVASTPLIAAKRQQPVLNLHPSPSWIADVLWRLKLGYNNYTINDCEKTKMRFLWFAPQGWGWVELPWVWGATLYVH